jgi:hypothetical protein
LPFKKKASTPVPDAFQVVEEVDCPVNTAVPVPFILNVLAVPEEESHATVEVPLADNVPVWKVVEEKLADPVPEQLQVELDIAEALKPVLPDPVAVRIEGALFRGN